LLISCFAHHSLFLASGEVLESQSHFFLLLTGGRFAAFAADGTTVGTETLSIEMRSAWGLP
jgi:hypothetical protein